MLSVRDLAVARGGVPVLSGVSFDLEPGAALVLRGPNGSGKTTLLRCLAGLQPAVSGQVTGFEDQVAYAGHSDGLKSMLRVHENLTFWADVFGFTGGIAPALAAFALEPLADRYAGQLSAGQKRRLGLARMMVTGRLVWILDEPTVSLDTASVQLFADAVGRHLASGGMAVLATHIAMGLDSARDFDVAPYRAKRDARIGSSDEAFL